MKIVIPSLGRAGTAPTMNWIHQAKRPVILAVHRDEAMAYGKAYSGIELMLLPDSVRRNAGKLRQYIMGRMEKPFFFVDDDASVRLVHFKTYEAMFNQLEKHMIKGKVPMAAIGKQIFSNAVIPKCEPMYGDRLAIRNKFASIVYGIDPRAFKTLDLRKLVVYEDCALIIHAIQNGGTIVSYSATHTNKTPPHGGCNSWRTKEIILSSLDELVRMYPQWCKKIETKHTAHGQDLGVGVRISWSRIGK